MAAQERQVPLLAQQWQDSRVTLATLLGEPVQRLPASRDLAADTQALDHALFELKLKPQAADTRAWPARSRAALGLLRRQAVCLGLQLSLALATLLTLPLKG